MTKLQVPLKFLRWPFHSSNIWYSLLIWKVNYLASVRTNTFSVSNYYMFNLMNYILNFVVKVLSKTTPIVFSALKSSTVTGWVADDIISKMTIWSSPTPSESYYCLNCNFRTTLRTFWQVNKKPMLQTTKFWICMIFHRCHVSQCPCLDYNFVVC